MKRLVLSVFCVLAASAMLAQTKPTGGDMSLGFKVTGLGNVAFSDWRKDDFQIPQMLYRYYFSDKLALRAGLGVDVTNSKYSFNDRYQVALGSPLETEIKIDTTVQNVKFAFIPGIEYHMTSPAAKIDPYVGLEAGVMFVGPTSTTYQYVKDSINTQANLVIEHQELLRSADMPGGLGINAGIFAGFNYFFSDNFAIGAEYTLGTSYLMTGGVVTENYQLTVTPNGPVIPKTTTSYIETNTDLNVKLRATGGVNISVFW